MSLFQIHQYVIVIQKVSFIEIILDLFIPADSSINLIPTRMHSSRMRTGRMLTVCCSLLPGGGCAWSGGGSAPRGGAWCGGGVSAPGGVPGLGGLPPGGCLVWGGVCLVWGGLPPGGVGIPACTEADTPPPPVDRHTLVKILPWPNFVAAGKNVQVYLLQHVEK